ncbi:MAG: hypothetical protein WD492_13275 [Alkalispirochaeta sp.]
MTAPDLVRFENHLIRQAKIPGNQAPYYLKWVREFLKFRAAGDPEATPEQSRALYTGLAGYSS